MVQQLNVTPKHDSSLGLIFRLNYLWEQADKPAKNGEYDTWNSVLDCIFRNLDYRDNYKLVKDKETGEIKGVEMDDEDFFIYKILCRKVFEAKRSFTKAHGKLKDGRDARSVAKAIWYNALSRKDRWLRKFMFRRKLYLQESEKTPGTALFGSFGHTKSKYIPNY